MAHHGLRRALRLTHRHATRHLHANVRRQSSASVAALLAEKVQKDDVTVEGYVRSIRNQKRLSFAAIGDGTTAGSLQALLAPELAQGLTTGAAVRLTGNWRASPNSTIQSHELHVRGVSLVGRSDPTTFPLQKKYQTPEYLRSIPHLRVRTPFNALLLQFRSRCIAQLTSYFSQRDFVQTHPPIITSSDCEGAGEVFNVNLGSPRQSSSSFSPQSGGGDEQSSDAESFFRRPKYLTVSSQLHLEAMAQSVGKVWALSPTFRAEKSDTSRHLSEFYMLEAEVNFADHLGVIMDLVEDVLRNLTNSMYQTRIGDEIVRGRRRPGSDTETPSDPTSHELESRWHGMMSGGWPRIAYADALDMLRQSGQTFQHTPTWESGLQAEHERFIATNVGRGKPVFVTAYPREIKPFYMLASDDGGQRSHRTVDCFDLLVPDVCEIAGGSMREHRLAQLLESMREHGLTTSANDVGEDNGANVDGSSWEATRGGLGWYVDLRRWGSVPHGGFGVGFDRLLGYLAGLSSVRDVVAFPRWVGRCDC